MTGAPVSATEPKDHKAEADADPDVDMHEAKDPAVQSMKQMVISIHVFSFVSNSRLPRTFHLRDVFSLLRHSHMITPRVHRPFPFWKMGT
jgi:hypothetical protein